MDAAKAVDLVSQGTMVCKLTPLRLTLSLSLVVSRLGFACHGIDGLRHGFDAGYVDPVVPLRLALYGHPDAGGYWEKHCDSSLQSLGFVPIDEWKSCYTHPKLGSSLLSMLTTSKWQVPRPIFRKPGISSGRRSPSTNPAPWVVSSVANTEG